jgi:predicted HTH domain antitoxin
MEAYKKSVMEYHDVRDAVLFAEERAEKRGEERGISIGEKRNRTEFAIKCYRKSMSIVEIADLTDLPIEEVKEILLREGKFRGIFRHLHSRKENSTEFSRICVT